MTTPVFAHAPDEYAASMRALLPPGKAWEWPVGGLGDAVINGTAKELPRIEAAAQDAINAGIAAHKPAATRWNISDYRAIAEQAVADVVEQPRKAFTVGSHAGERLWSAAGATFNVPFVEIRHLVGPLVTGFKVGARCWSDSRSRYFLEVRYYAGVVDPAKLWAALTQFKQSHVRLFFVDITGNGGSYSGQN